MYFSNTSGIKLNSVYKQYTLEQDKIRAPEETTQWVLSAFDRLGQKVLRNVQRIDTGRLDIPVFISHCGEDATLLTGTQKQMGKGASSVQAEASALMELAERFSFFHFIRTKCFVRSTASQVFGPLMHFRQIAQAVSHSSDDLARVYKIYSSLPQNWVWVYNLTTEQEEIFPLNWFYAINEYNGVASGNCQEEAILQSLCEVIERHVSAVVTLDRLPTRSIHLKSIYDPIALELITKLEAGGIEICLKDFSCGIGIPTVAALCWDPLTLSESSEIVYAAGTATSPTKALVRALTEIAQLAGDFCTFSNYKVSALPKFTNLKDATYVIEPDGIIDLDVLPNCSNNDLYQEIKNCVCILAKRGYMVYTLNVSHDKLQVPTVYTLIPGAHFAYRTTTTNVFFHTAKLVSKLDDSEQILKLQNDIIYQTGDIYFLHFFRGLALIDLKKPLEALIALEFALSLDPPVQDKVSIYTQCGVALKDLARYEEAKQLLIYTISFSKPHYEIFNLLGFCHFMLKDYEASIAAFESAIKVEPGLAINYANIGSNLRRIGKQREASKMYKYALELDPNLDLK